MRTERMVSICHSVCPWVWALYIKNKLEKVDWNVFGAMRSTEQPLCENFFDGLGCISMEKRCQMAVYTSKKGESGWGMKVYCVI